MSVTELREARRAAGIEDDEGLLAGPGDQEASAADRAEGEPEPDELFPVGTVDGDPAVTHKNIIPARVPIKLEAKLSQIPVPLTAGLHAYGHRGEVLVTFEAGKTENRPDFGDIGNDGRAKVNAVTIVQMLRPIHVRSAEDMFTREQVLEILAELQVPTERITEVLGE